jgi:hypothetical protein
MISIESMAPIRRHLASFGLAVAACYLVIQVLVPAAICCQGANAAARVQAECCPAGAHPGQLCPMHASSRSKQADGTRSECHAKPSTDLHDLFIALTSGGVMPPHAPKLHAPDTSEPAPATAMLSALQAPARPLGPPPRS